MGVPSQNKIKQLYQRYLRGSSSWKQMRPFDSSLLAGEFVGWNLGLSFLFSSRVLLGTGCKSGRRSALKLVFFFTAWRAGICWSRAQKVSMREICICILLISGWWSNVTSGNVNCLNTTLFCYLSRLSSIPSGYMHNLLCIYNCCFSSWCTRLKISRQ